jgi:hypothetical protein
MGKALEVISGRVTAPGAVFTAVTMAAGNSLTVRNAPLDTDVRLLQAWADNQAAGVLRIRSPKLHDNVQGIRFDIKASDPTPLMPAMYAQKLISQDALIVEMTGSAVGGDIEQFGALLYYANLPGSDARLATPAEVLSRVAHVVTVENTITTGAGGGYTGEEAINAEFDLLKANTDYALLGYHVDVECAVVRWRGADTANLGLGGPGTADHDDLYSQWFVWLSDMYALPLIPVFASANKGAILIDVVQDENAAAVTVTSILAEIGPTPAITPAR